MKKEGGKRIDITARLHAERLLEIQRDLAVELSGSKDLRAAYRSLLAAATRLPGFDCGGVYDRRDDGSLELLAHCGLSEEFVGLAGWHDAWTPQAELVGRGELVYMVRADLPPVIGGRLEAEGLEALAVIPLCDGGRVIGALNVSSHRHSRIDAGSRVALESLAAQAAGGIARIRAEEGIRRLNETLEQRVRERTRELEAANRLLRESEEKYRRLHESMMDAFVSVDMDGRILETNGAYRQMLGYDEQELGGLTYRDITPERWHAIEQRFVDEQILRRGWSDVYEKEYRRKDGVVFPVELRTILIRDACGRPVGMWAMVRDISRRKAAEAEIRQLNENLGVRVRERTRELEVANAALRESEARFRTLGEAAFEGLVISEGGRIVDVNRQALAIYRYGIEEVIGRPLLDFIAPRSHELVAERVGGEVEGGFSYFGLRKDGSEFPCESRARMVTWEGRRLRMAAVRDLTEVREAEAALAALRGQVARFQRLAEVSEINMGVVHQLSQPLSAISNNVAFVRAMMRRRGVTDADLLEAVGAVQEDLGRARETIVRLRALAHPERPQRSRVEINDIVADLVRLLGPEAEARRVRLQLACTVGLPPVHVDAVQMHQAVLNLARNALDAVDGLEDGRREVTISTSLVGARRIEIVVRDRGVGIRPEEGAKLFETIFTTKPGGMGVGLRLTRTIVEAHGGTVEGFDHGGGATFRIVLPVGDAGSQGES